MCIEYAIADLVASAADECRAVADDDCAAPRRITDGAPLPSWLAESDFHPGEPAGAVR